MSRRADPSFGPAEETEGGQLATSMQQRRLLRRMVGLLFVSGMCSLVFQVSWFREFRLVFGASTAASSAVLAVFMGGLGIGNAVLGARADRAKNPLLLYARLEITIALAAACSPFLIEALHQGYIALGGQSTLGLPLATAVRLGISLVVLGLPTFLMGGTLPAAARAATASDDRQRRGAAWLYGANTLGAVVGAFGTTFCALELFGTKKTLWLACLLNCGTALLAFAASRLPSATRTPSQGNTSPGTSPEESAVSSGYFVYVVAAAVGFSFFLMELVWYRMLGPILGGTTFTFGLILTVALTGIGLGGAAYALLFRHRRVSLHELAITCTLEGCCIAVPFALGDRLAILAGQLRAANQGSFAAEVTGWAAIAAIVILPAAFISGLQFPLLIALLGQGTKQIGKQVGLIFGWNTVGAIVGSLAGGFGILPLFSAPEVWRGVAVLLILLGLIAFGLGWRRSKRRLSAATNLLVAAVAMTLAAGRGPTAVWRHSGIGVGRGIPPGELADPNARRNGENKSRRMVVWEADGVESSVAIAKEDGLTFIVNGKGDGNATTDAGTQIMLGLIGGALHREPRTAFVVGLGTGETAGWLAEIRSIQKVDVVELEPVVQEMARRCRDVNHDVLSHDKVRLIINDAREVLLTSRETYDLIVCEPSNPYRSGVANLFTEEFYRAGSSRLNEGGMFVQWLQAYEIDDRTVRTVLATFRSVFPFIELWETLAGDLVLVGCHQKRTNHVAAMRGKLAEEPFASALLHAWHTTELEGFFSRYVGGPALVEQIIGSGPYAINTDDHNEIEYGFARMLGRSNRLSLDALRRQSVELGDQRPLVDEGAVDWEAVDLDHRWFIALRHGTTPISGAGAEPNANDAVLERLVAQDPAGMLAAWETIPHPVSSLTELSVISTSYAEAGSTKCEPLLQQLARHLPLEAEAIHGILAYRQGNANEASQHLAKALGGLREDPWMLPETRERALVAAVQVARMSPNAELFEAVAGPYLVYVADEHRHNCACLMAMAWGPETAARFVEEYEPDVHWTEKFLRFRKEVYAGAGHPLADQADRDLQEFMRQRR